MFTPESENAMTIGNGSTVLTRSTDSLPFLSDVELVPVRPEHFGELYRWSTDPASSFRWRFSGATPSPEQFAVALWTDVLCQFVAVDRATGAPHGLVVCYGASHKDGYAYAAVLGNPSRPTGTGAMVALLRLVDHVFTHFAFRKIYFEIPEYNLTQFGSSIHKYLTVEGRLKEHTFYRGQYADQVITRLSRVTWDDVVQPRFARFLGAASDSDAGSAIEER